MDDFELEEEFISNLRELNHKEQDAIRIFSAMYVNSYEKLKNDKVESFDRSIAEQIKFYGREKDEYLSSIKLIVDRYSEQIDKIINQYNTWLCAILNKLQDTYNNQKIAMTNIRFSIKVNDEVKKMASENKVNNCEIIIQECKSQLEECKLNMENKLNEIFFSRENGLCLKKVNIFQKIINIFTGKSRINNFVISSLNREMSQLENDVNEWCEKIENKVINKIAIIEDAIIQSQTIFNNMLEEYKYEQ